MYFICDKQGPIFESKMILIMFVKIREQWQL